MTFYDVKFSRRFSPAPPHPRTVIARLLATFWTLGIVAALAWPRPDVPSPPTPIPFDKLVHVGLFAGFGLMWMCASRAALGRRTAGVFGTGLLFAVATEAGQRALPYGRTVSALDALADAVGLALGVAAFYAARRWLRFPAPSSGADSPHAVD